MKVRKRSRGVYSQTAGIFSHKMGESGSNPGDKEIPSSMWSVSRFIFYIILHYPFGITQFYKQMFDTI